MTSPRTGQTRRPLARIHVIHEQLSSGAFPNCSSLADLLEVSTKTIHRDLDFMRDEFGMPLEFDPQRNGYAYTKPVEAFPPVRIGMEELMALFVARKPVGRKTGGRPTTAYPAPAAPRQPFRVDPRLGRDGGSPGTRNPAQGSRTAGPPDQRTARKDSIMNTPHPYCYWVEPGILLAGEYPREFEDEEGSDKLQCIVDTGISLGWDWQNRNRSRLLAGPTFPG